MNTQLFSRYEILETLGKGGMGEVLKARDVQLKRLVAIKRLLPEALGDKEAQGRFLREARLAAQLNHPNIATIYDILDSGEEAFIVMEYIEGETLRERISHGPLPLETVFDLGIQIGSALAAAHQQDVIHRDIKSENIKVTSTGHIKVLDFGLAKQMLKVDQTIEETVRAESVFMTQQGFAAGTPGYTAPEQWKGGQVDGRADIFSFGVVLYEMITGQSPFPGKSVIERITATMHNDPEPVTHYASVPNRVEHIVRKALAKDPARRYQSMAELVGELEALRQQTVDAAIRDVTARQPAPATLASRYKILIELGEGGMGKVYQAKDLKLDRIVAIKELRRGILSNDTVRARFLREASLLAKLNHRHIATVHDIIEEDDRIFIVMEYIEGERLLDKIKRGPLPPAEAYQHALEMAQALEHAHGKHIIHRDIKSANIMVTLSGEAKVLDFGLAKQIISSSQLPVGHSQTVAAELTETRITFGTPKYMSPEQRMTADVDERSDIFSYGVVLCEMLVGEVSYMGEVLAELLEADSQLWPAPLNRMPKHWQPIVKKSLARDPQFRYQSFTDLIADLKQVKTGAEARTEMATVAVERREVVRKVGGPRIMPTLARSALGLAPAVFFLHQVTEHAGSTKALLYLLLTFVAPIVVFYLPRYAARRSGMMRDLVDGTHSVAFPLMMVNIILLLLTSIAIFDFLGWQSWGDWRYVINNEPAKSDIVLVAIDEKTKRTLEEKGVSLREGELWRLRQFHPEVLQKIAGSEEGKPKVVAFDLYFNDASEFDDEFASALIRLQKNGIPVLVGQNFDPQEKSFNQTTPKIREALTADGDLSWGHPIVLSDQAGGSAEMEKGTVRIAPLRIIQTEEMEGALRTESYPSISLRMATAGKYERSWRVSDGKLRADRLEIPVDSGIQYVKNLPENKYHFDYENMIINYPTTEFTTVSYSDILYGTANISFFQKYVLIGYQYAAYEPYRDTPLGAWSPYKIHASALNTILTGDYIARFSGVPKLLVLLLVSYVVLALILQFPKRSWVLLGIAGGTWVLLFALAMFLFWQNRIWFDSSYPGLAAAVTGILAYWKR